MSQTDLLPSPFKDLLFKVAVMQPMGTVTHLIADREKAIVGQVVEIKAKEPYGIGSIPDCLVTIKGRSGKTFTASFVETYTEIYPAWSEALKSLPKGAQ
jgi:hypothetical protein